MKNNLNLIVEFWGMWVLHKKNGGKISDLTIEFKKHSVFENAIESIKNKLGLIQTSLFNNDDDYGLIRKKALTVVYKLKKEGIGVITYDQFSEFKALKDIKGSHFFFYRGDLSLLQKDKSEFSAVIGSRKTPESYKKYLKRIPTDKIIVSGLANGADVMGHEWAMQNNKKIVVFPGTDIYNKPKTGIKKKIFEYADKNGLLLTEVFPGSNSFDKSMFLKRNKWMAQMTDSTYALYFDGMSGTLGQLTEAVKTNSSVYIPEIVLKKNKDFFGYHPHLMPIYKAAKCL